MIQFNANFAKKSITGLQVSPTSSCLHTTTLLSSTTHTGGDEALANARLIKNERRAQQQPVSHVHLTSPVAAALPSLARSFNFRQTPRPQQSKTARTNSERRTMTKKRRSEEVYRRRTAPLIVNLFSTLAHTYRRERVVNRVFPIVPLRIISLSLSLGLRDIKDKENSTECLTARLYV